MFISLLPPPPPAPPPSCFPTVARLYKTCFTFQIFWVLFLFFFKPWISTNAQSKTKQKKLSPVLLSSYATHGPHVLLEEFSSAQHFLSAQNHNPHVFAPVDNDKGTRTKSNVLCSSFIHANQQLSDKLYALHHSQYPFSPLSKSTLQTGQKKKKKDKKKTKKKKKKKRTKQ